MEKLFFSPRLTQKLLEMRRMPVTSVIAPIGYGKTCAINRFKQELPAETLVIHQFIQIDDFDFFWQDFLEQANPLLNAPLQLPVPCTESQVIETVQSLLRLANGPIYWIVEDLHLIQDTRFFVFFDQLGRMMTEDVHVIISSRSVVLSHAKKFELQGRLLEITPEDLSLTATEIIDFGRLFDLKLLESEALLIAERTEGWISAVRLLLIDYRQSGHFGGLTNIYDMIQDILLTPLTTQQQEILAVLAMVGDFSSDLAKLLCPQIEWQALKSFIEENGFVFYQAGSYHMHLLLQEALRPITDSFTAEKRTAYIEKVSYYYFENGQYLEGALWAEKVGNFDIYLRGLELGGGLRVTNRLIDDLLTRIGMLEDHYYEKYPQAILISLFIAFAESRMEAFFTVQGRLQEIYPKSRLLTQKEKDRITGELLLIESFFAFNDIKAMGEKFQQAAALLEGPSEIISPHFSWTFCSPSVLALYYKEPTKLAETLTDMKHFLPYYVDLTAGHGAGAADMMQGEVLFMQGDVTRSRLAIQKGERAARLNQQTSILLCGIFHRIRFAMLDQDLAEVDRLFEECEQQVKETPNPEIRLTVDIMRGFIYGQLQQFEALPQWVLAAEVDANELPELCRPIYGIVISTLLLAKEEYHEMIIREDELKAYQELYPSVINQMYLQIHLAVAYERIDLQEEADQHLQAALALAEPGKIMIPFIEHKEALCRLLAKTKLTPHETEFLATCFPDEIAGTFYPNDLTPVETQITELVSLGRSNSEIAEELKYSEGTVKQYLNRIYLKFNIRGNARNKRDELVRFPL